MYQIALCADVVAEIERMEYLLTEYGKRNQEWQYQTERFENTQSLLDWIREERGKPDLLLMDIFMPGKTGIDAVRELRKEKYDVPVIFLTSSKEHALNAYEVDA